MAASKFHQTVVHMLADAGVRSGDQPALVFGECQLSYTEFLRCVGGFSRELEELGARGARVALVCGNSIEMAIAMFAIHAAGAQAVPVNPIYTGRELGHILSDADPIAVIYDTDVASVVKPLMKELEIANGICIGDNRLINTWKNDREARLPVNLPAPDDLATLQYTGGTTGLPKGVNITHGQMITNIRQREAVLPTIPDDESVLCVMPLFHVFAVSMCLHLTVCCRGKLVILPRYKPDLVFQAISMHNITRFPAGPTVFIGLMAAEGFSATDFSSLRTAYSGSAPLAEETLKKWETLTGCPILEGYGQSEAGPILTYIGENMEPKPGSVGPPVSETEIRIVDDSDGIKILGVGEIGEIWAKGPQIMQGYRNRPEETAAAFHDGWLRTGDMGELDKDGYLYIRDRKKDMVISGGYNVYPREVDEILYNHPDVLEAAAIGIPDDYRGEVIKAFIVLKPGATITDDDLRTHCSKNLAKYKVPAVFELVSEIAKTPVGKVDKNALRGS